MKYVIYLNPFDSGAKCDHPKRGGSDTESASPQHIEIIIGDEQEFKMVLNWRESKAWDDLATELCIIHHLQ